MTDEYDVIICGSGLVECIISLALCQEGTLFKKSIFKTLYKAKKFCILIEIPSLEVKERHLTWILFGNSFDLV